MVFKKLKSLARSVRSEKQDQQDVIPPTTTVTSPTAKGSPNATDLVENQEQNNIITYEWNDEFNMEASIHHYMPARFPFVQKIYIEDVENFKTLWMMIYNDNELGVGGKNKLATLFDIFYHNLFARSEKFRDYFGTNYKERCRVLTRQLMFFTTLKLDATLPTVFAELGKLHQKLRISNFQYAMFAEVLLESIASVIGKQADRDLMHSATRVVSFCLFELLKATLSDDLVLRSEMNVNFQDAKVEDIINQLSTDDLIHINSKVAESIASRSVKSGGGPKSVHSDISSD